MLLQCCLINGFWFWTRFLDAAHALDEHVRSTFLWEYPADALKLGEHTSTRETLRGIKGIEETDADLQAFTRKATAAFR
jgi:hypothetical protein